MWGFACAMDFMRVVVSSMTKFICFFFFFFFFILCDKIVSLSDINCSEASVYSYYVAYFIGLI